MHAISSFRTKACTKCGQLKHIGSFHRDARARDGRESQCTPCRLAQRKTVSNGVPVVLVNERCGACGELRPVGEFHKDRGKPRGLQHRCRDCDAARQANRAAKKYGCEGTLTGLDIRGKFDRLGNECFYCGLPASENVHKGKKNGRLDVEHVTPLSRGGSNTIGNIVPSCTACNRMKFGKTTEELVAWAERLLTTLKKEI